MDTRLLNNPIPLTTSDFQLRLSQVNNLLEAKTNNWNVSVIYSVFDPLKAAAILKISLCFAVHCDKLIWESEKNEIFIVKSAYKLIQNSLAVEKGESSRTCELQHF